MVLWTTLYRKSHFGTTGGPIITKTTLLATKWISTLVPQAKIDKILIANRGEIACRVIRTAEKLGVKTVAVYSGADQNSLHVSQADEAYNIGPPPATQSYLLGDKILEVATRARCQAVHPGYGFLSENVEFAEKCERAGIVFIGPPASAIRDMGIKSKSKEIMSAAGVPIIKGYHGSDQTLSKLREEALKIGFPVMIKAVRGGGGKGMRIALSESEFEEALKSARSEAEKSFGDSVVLLEQFVAEPRHVEVQVFADLWGNAVHLFERDCSVQRRHQKIIEEAPAPGISDELRMELGAAAVRAAKAVGYVGAGTVEFILDRKSHEFHFMEMNTRLQVEHPITEMVTGTDLVEWQIKVAQGEKLPFTQDEITLKGHAFEARIYAEDPSGGFLPGAGTLTHLSTPAPREDIRIETGVRDGDEVSIHYDPMIAKLVVWGQNRPEALRKLQSSLLQYNIAGLETNVNFLLDLSRHPEFSSGNVHTNFIKDHFDTLFKVKKVLDHQVIQATLATILGDQIREQQQSVDRSDNFNPFLVEAAFRINHKLVRDFKLKFKDQEFAIKVRYLEGNNFEVSLNGGNNWSRVQGSLHLDKNTNKTVLKSTIDGIKSHCNVFVECDKEDQKHINIFDENGKIEFLSEKPFPDADLIDKEDSTSSTVASPMPGVLDKVLVKLGDRVKKGDSLFVLIAMKMELVVKSNRDGIVSDVFFQPGENVMKDTIVVQFAEDGVKK